MADNISAISYTNKDFQTIYPELLDLATRISKRWTPDQTNESDPGIVLAKIAALCADKNNYNIDKNVLEYFPSSVTQMPNAREVFAQRGYYMHWYQAAEGEITLAVKSGSDIADSRDYTSVRISDTLFPTITGGDGKVVYTIKPDSAENDIKNDGTPRTFEVIQGAAKQYNTAGGSSTITVADLDAERRLYFPNTSVAENGIFISHMDASKDWREWERVASVDAEPIGDNRFIYEFGVSRDGSNCYIQFPDNITSIIGNGIEIWYVESVGVSGNIPAFYLTKFANDTQGDYLPAKADKTYDSVSLNSDNIVFSQSSSIVNGANPETIEEAYRAYTKTVGTFDTLVTIRDYDNALTKAPDVSNGFVTDRTNDIQRAYQIISEQNNVNVVLDHTYQTTSGTDDILAFDLCVYEFDNMPQTSTWADSDYNSTFNMLANYDDKIGTKINSRKSYFEQNNKSIQHDFVTWQQGRPLCIKNKYNVNCKIIPQYSVTELQANEIKNNIIQALYKNLNSSKIDFGEEVTFERVYNIIADSDERIKSVSLGNIEFTPWIVYWDSASGLRELEIKSLSEYNKDATKGSDTDVAQQFEIEIFAKSILSGHTPLFNLDKNINYSLAQTTINNIDDATTVTTETKIPIGTSESSATTLLDGESVIFYAPSMITDTPYSLGVKYVVNAGVSANETKNVGFVALWKKDGKYYAHKYDGVYVKPSFQLTTSDNYATIAGAVPATNVDADVSGVGTIVNSWNSLASIATSGSISVMVKNTQTIGTSDYCSWILNNVTYDSKNNGQWVLFPASTGATSTSPITQEYALAPGEYFIASDSQKQNMTIFGAGTLISRTLKSEAKELSIPSYFYATNWTSDGMSAIDSDRLVTGVEITATEREYVALGAGASLWGNQSASRKEIGNDEVDVNKLSIQYSSDSGSGSLEQRGDDIGWMARSFLAFNTMDGAMKLSNSRQTVAFDNATSGDAQFVQGNTTNPWYIQTSPQYNMIGGEGLSLQYVTSDSTMPKSPNIVVYHNQMFPAGGDVQLSDDGSVLLSASGSSSKTVKLYGVASTAYKRFFRVLKSDAPTFDIDDLTPIKSDNIAKRTTLYYMLPTDFKTETVRFVCKYYPAVNGLSERISVGKSDEPNNQLVYTRVGSAPTGSSPFLGMWQSAKGDRVISISTSGSDFVASYNNSDYVLCNITGAHGEDLETAVFEIQAMSITYQSTTSITISPLYKVKDVANTVITPAANDAVYSKVIELDQKGEFNYMYDVPAEKLIKDPLLGESFVNVEHPYNQFTMCQMNTDKSSVEIFNKLSSR